MNQKAKITLIKKDPCPYCDRAMNFFNSRDLKVEIIDLTDKPDEIGKLKEKYGWQTVPMILINDVFVGGYNDLKALDEKGKLAQMLLETKSQLLDFLI